MNYLLWHYYKAPKFILNLILNYIYFVGHVFSVKVLLKTLISPWKREIVKKENPGFNPQDLFNTISFNIISRIIGFIIRVATLITALLFFFMVIFLGVVLFIVWLLIPVLSLPIFFLTENKNDQNKKNNFVISHLEDAAEEKNAASVTNWYERTKLQEKKKKEFWSRENLLSIPGIGENWAYGYTLLLNKLTIDITTSNFSLENLVGRKEEIDNLQRLLSKEENPNVILIGETGVGLMTIITALAKLIQSGKSQLSLLYKKVLLLDLDLLLAKTQAETQQNLIKVLEEAKNAGNIILVIPSFDQFIRNDENHINLTEVFSQHLADNKMQIIAVTDSYSYQKYVLTNQTLLKLFGKIDISEPSEAETITILEDKAYELEKKYKTTATYESLIEIIKETGDLITDTSFPQKAIDVLEEIFVFAKTKGITKISENDADEVLSQKTKLPLGKLKTTEKEALKNLEEILHKRVIGQDTAITKVSQALRRKVTGTEVRKAPIGTFLFLGSTGVGKTETAKALAEVYFRSEERMVRLDMSEFQNENDINKLIGEDDNPGILTSNIRQNPFTVLLLDEFEKANSKILNIFLTVFDEGYLTDGKGKKVNFKNTIIIATSNAGSEFIREKLNNGASSELDKEITEYLLTEKIFSPELINRFDDVVFYKPLEKAELEQIAKLMLDRLAKKLQEEQEITLLINPETITKLVEKGYDVAFGARNLQRTIQEEVENVVANKILDGSAKKGSQVEINL